MHQSAHHFNELYESFLFSEDSVEFGSGLEMISLVQVVDDVGGKLLDVEQRRQSLRAQRGCHLFKNMFNYLT